MINPYVIGHDISDPYIIAFVGELQPCGVIRVIQMKRTKYKESE